MVIQNLVPKVSVMFRCYIKFESAIYVDSIKCFFFFIWARTIKHKLYSLKFHCVYTFYKSTKKFYGYRSLNGLRTKCDCLNNDFHQGKLRTFNLVPNFLIEMRKVSTLCLPKSTKLRLYYGNIKHLWYCLSYS